MLVVFSSLMWFSYILQLDREVKTEHPLLLASWKESLGLSISVWYEAAGMERPYQ
jgi:hypothetical protein